jgi:hypothetical protein
MFCITDYNYNLISELSLDPAHSPNPPDTAASGKKNMDLWHSSPPRYSDLFLSTPMTVFTSSSFCFKTVSLSSSWMKVPRRRMHSASCLLLGDIARMKYILLVSGGRPWSLNSSSIKLFVHCQAALTF